MWRGAAHTGSGRRAALESRPSPRPPGASSRLALRLLGRKVLVEHGRDALEVDALALALGPLGAANLDVGHHPAARDADPGGAVAEQLRDWWQLEAADPLVAHLVPNHLRLPQVEVSSALGHLLGLGLVHQAGDRQRERARNGRHRGTVRLADLGPSDPDPGHVEHEAELQVDPLDAHLDRIRHHLEALALCAARGDSDVADRERLD
mmetsp:Transcript_3000/g.10012  ORF Transcript_3000/g.10012 Transcript_3000/m.10012 type:complete len:207 (+) Transcript_3000:253-873(+)